MKNYKLIVLIFLVFIQTLPAQELDREKLDTFFDMLESSDRFMGSVAVSREGQIIYVRAVGYADVENNSRADLSSKYRIGSISKTFTSLLVLKAVEEGLLSPDQSIEGFFPMIEHADKITIRHLLQHQSGIHSFTDDEDYVTWNTEPKTEEEMIGIIAKAGSDFKPGRASRYSNSNFVLLTYLLERIFGKSYAELLEEHITRPAGLQDTYLGGPINPDNNECKSYSFLKGWKAETETDISIPLGAGGIVSTPSDLVKFGEALFGGELLSPESLESMQTMEGPFGMGLVKIPFNRRTGYGHGGGIDGFSSVFSYFPDGKVSYALTSNGTRMNNNDISIAVLSAAYGKPFDLPEFSTYEINPSELDRYVGVYASAELPLKITVTREDNTLIAQGTGQPSFPLEPASEHTFTFEQAGVVMEFDPGNGSMILKQAGGTYSFSKE